MIYNDFIPVAAQQKVNELLNNEPVLIKVVKKRKTKHGDFRKISLG